MYWGTVQALQQHRQIFDVTTNVFQKKNVEVEDLDKVYLKPTKR